MSFYNTGTRVYVFEYNLIRASKLKHLNIRIIVGLPVTVHVRKLCSNIHVSVNVLSDVLSEKAFKLFNCLVFFGSKYRSRKLRAWGIQEKYEHI